MRHKITDGSHHQDLNRVVSLTDLGKSIVAPTDNDDVMKLKIKALLNIQLYKNLIDSMNHKKIPLTNMLENTLTRTYNVMKQDATICAKTFLDNLSDFKLKKQKNDGVYLELDVDNYTSESNTTSDQEQNDGSNESGDNSSGNKPLNKKIFIGHGKNLDTLKQLKETLDKFKIPYNVAIDEPNQGMPISDKISKLMIECTSAIFLFTKDDEIKDSDGNTIYRPSMNVVYELALASHLYKNKIVIFKEEGVSLGSDFSNLGYIPFKNNEINMKDADLIKELIEFGLFTVNLT